MKGLIKFLVFIHILLISACGDDDDTESSLTVWTGDKITFTKEDAADPTLEVNQDRITDNVWLTRGNDGGPMYNIVIESEASRERPNPSPRDTEWALGTTAEVENLIFEPFLEAIDRQATDLAGKELVLHLITDDVYLDVKFISWSAQRMGGFSYERSTE